MCLSPKDGWTQDYYYHYRHDPNGSPNHDAYHIYSVCITPKTIAAPKMPPCRVAAIVRHICLLAGCLICV
jgi:hypothetical protein